MRKRLQVLGTVQGVGFRPFVYNLARSLGVNGFVLNTSTGVTIEAEADMAYLVPFLDRLSREAPTLARIESVATVDIPCTGVPGFAIRSTVGGAGLVLVPPDIATCEACYRDFTDPSNRRYQYPFTNCTNCGPRYTIIREVPYDRPATTMASFRMCTECQKEYDDPGDRRFHAQPNACPACGPWLEFWDRDGLIAQRSEALAELRSRLATGAIVAIKGLGGFHLACDALNVRSVRLLRERKHRIGKPLAVMARSLEVVERVCLVGQPEREHLTGSRRPVVILQRRADSPVSPAVAPGVNTLGVMLPYTPLHHLLFGGEAPYELLVMTSGNMGEEPIACRNDEARTRLHSLCDCFLLHNRDIQARADDSVVRLFRGSALPVRRSRGYAPEPIDLHTPLRPVVAVGAELKNTLCMTRDHHAILSHHIGDLENYETLQFFRETYAHMGRFFNIVPEAVAHDLHPGYISTRFAKTLTNIRRIEVQHHHAHVAACAAEHGIRENVIGVAFDGTGLGTDGQVWGGEFLVCNWEEMERVAHFRYVPMAGGDAAIRQPWRMALSYLVDSFGSQLPEIPNLKSVPRSSLDVVETALRRGVNVVQTSSCGRLFDAVASLVGVCQSSTYEGEAAIRLETAAADSSVGAYPFDLDGPSIDWRPTIRAIVGDLSRGVPVPTVSARFHNSVIQCIAETCRRIRSERQLARVCLTGGAFQNLRLLDGAVRELQAKGFQVCWHRRVPTNDGGIAFGQAVIANAILARAERT